MELKEVKTEKKVAEDEKKGKLKFFSKLKSIKNIELIIAVVIICIILLVYFGGLQTSETSKSSEITSTKTIVGELESKLKNTLSTIKGAGKVDVLISTSGDTEYEYAYIKDYRVVDGTIYLDKEQLAIAGGSPIIVKEKGPEITGVVIVAEGAGDVFVKIDLIKAVETALTIPSSKIEVFKRK